LSFPEKNLLKAIVSRINQSVSLVASYVGHLSLRMEREATLDDFYIDMNMDGRTRSMCQYIIELTLYTFK